MAHILVLGASGDVGRGIASVLAAGGHQVIGVGRDAAKLDRVAAELGKPAGLHMLAGSIGNDEQAAVLAEQVRAFMAAQGASALDAVVVSINASRLWAPLMSLSAETLLSVLREDLVSHFVALKTFLPLIRPGGVHIGIGGGSADFVLHEGGHMSAAQAGLRMLYRAMIHELGETPVHLRELTVASVVNAASNRDSAHPAWVKDTEIGELVARMIADPAAFPDPIWRIMRRDETGKPVIRADGPTYAQGIV